MDAQLTTDVTGTTGWVIIDNPARRNAMTLDMWKALPDCIDTLEADPNVRVLAVTGAGTQAFVSGADISEFDTLRATVKGAEAYDQAVERALLALRECRHPTLAAIRGYCFGGGMGIALACDLRYAREDAVFAIPAAKLGVGYAFALTQDLVNVVGPAFAREILFTAGRYSAQDAHRMGLVSRVYGHGTLGQAVRDLCEDLAANAPLSIRTAKRAILEAVAVSDRARAELVAQMVHQCFDSEDYIEGRAAFLEKRRPRFKGR